MEVGEYIVKLLISFIALAGVLILVLWFLRKKGLIPEIQNSGKLKVISSIKLTPKAYLFIVKVGDREIIVGVNDKSVNLIYEIGGERERPNLSAH